MDALAPYRIPTATLKANEASFEWKLNTGFLALFDEVHEGINGQFTVKMDFTREGSIINLDFYVTGEVDTICDRCMVSLKMPIQADYQMLVNYGNPDDSTDEVLFVSADSHNINVGKHLYDFVLLSVPISQRIPNCESMENSPCDTSILSFLSENKTETNPNGDDDQSPWDELKKVIDN